MQNIFETELVDILVSKTLKMAVLYKQVTECDDGWHLSRPQVNLLELVKVWASIRARVRFRIKG